MNGAGDLVWMRVGCEQCRESVGRVKVTRVVTRDCVLHGERALVGEQVGRERGLK